MAYNNRWLFQSVSSLNLWVARRIRETSMVSPSLYRILRVANCNFYSCRFPVSCLRVISDSLAWNLALLCRTLALM